MSLKVEFTSTQIKDLKGDSKKTGEPYHLRIQSGYIWTLDPATNTATRHPSQFEIMLDADQAAYPVGFYELSEASIQVNRQGRLSVTPIFLQIKVQPKAA